MNTSDLLQTRRSHKVGRIERDHQGKFGAGASGPSSQGAGVRVVEHPRVHLNPYLSTFSRIATSQGRNIIQEQDKENKAAEFIANPRRAVWQLSLPVMAGMLIYTLYSITDWIFVGRLGSDAVAALSFTVPLVFFALGVTFGLGTGATSVIARFLGADNKKQADNAARHAILIGLAVAIAIVAGALLFKYEILTVLGTSGHVRELAVIYFEIIALSFIFGLLNVSFRSIMTGEGNTRTPVMIQACGTVLNIILDPVLIFWAELGIAGAAWATFASQLIVFVIFIYYIYVRRASYLDLRFTRFSLDRKLVYGILSVGIPASGAMLIMSSGSMFFNRIISVFGNEAVAGFGVGGRLDAVYFMPTFAIATSQVTLAGMFLGAGRIDLIRQTLLYSILRAEVIAVFVGVVFYLFSPAIFPVFTDNPAIVDIAVSYMRIIVFVFPFVTVGVISTRTFQGLGSGLPSLFLTSLRVIIIAVPLALLFTRGLGYGLTSVWVAFLISGVLSSAVAITWLMLRLRRIEAERGAQSAGDLPVGARA